MLTSIMVWKICPNYPMHEVSEHGDVRQIGGRRINGRIDADGYVRYHLPDVDGCFKSPAAHNLVADAFLETAPSAEYQIAHNNGSKLCNHYTNLRWATCQENMDDKLVHATAASGEGNPKAKITENDVHLIRVEYRAIKAGNSRMSLSDLENKYDLCRGQLIRIAKGLAWRHIPMPPIDQLYEGILEHG